MIFVDTGAFLARYVARDQFHRQAVAAWDRLRRERTRCFTSNFVLDETITLLTRRAGYAFAAERACALFASKTLRVLRPDRRDELEALHLFEKYGDQLVSFTDCISFVLMKNNGLKQAFSFDEHFARAGFTLFP